MDIRSKVVGKVHDEIPAQLTDNEDAMAYYGVIKPFIKNHGLSRKELETVIADTAVAVHAIVEKHRKVNLWDDEDAQKQTENEIDDYLYDELKNGKNIDLSPEQMDTIIEKVLLVAKHRSYR
jgi:type I restriction enzyme R subunit